MPSRPASTRNRSRSTWSAACSPSPASASPQLPEDGAQSTLHINERFAGSFRRVISLPEDADPDAVEASFRTAWSTSASSAAPPPSHAASPSTDDRTWKTDKEVNHVR